MYDLLLLPARCSRVLFLRGGEEGGGWAHQVSLNRRHGCIAKLYVRAWCTWSAWDVHRGGKSIRILLPTSVRDVIQTKHVLIASSCTPLSLLKLKPAKETGLFLQIRRCGHRLKKCIMHTLALVSLKGGALSDCVG